MTGQSLFTFSHVIGPGVAMRGWCSALGERANEEPSGPRWPWERWYTGPDGLSHLCSRAFRPALAMGEVVQRAGRLLCFTMVARRPPRADPVPAAPPRWPGHGGLS